jgi:uncharacterized protein YxjI
MRYAIKQKLISHGDDFSILDANGKEVFFVDGHVFSFGKKLTVLNQQKREVALIRQKLLTFSPTYLIFQNGRQVAKIHKRRFSFRPRFFMDVDGPNDYEIAGNFINYEYTFSVNKREVATVSKRYFSYADTYGVEITGGNAELILCCAIVIDLVLHVGK